MNILNYSDEITKMATVPQAMERYKISRKTLMKYANDLDAVVRFGRSVRINCTKMDAYVDGKASDLDTE